MKRYKSATAIITILFTSNMVFPTRSMATQSKSKTGNVVKSKAPSMAKHQKQKKNSVGANVDIQRTESFLPVTHQSLNPDSKVKVHTLLLGTHPSIQSLAKSRYYGHPMNTFWWIAGDNLGFRRDTGISPSSGQPYQFTKDLLYSQEHIISYEEQLEKITSHGFALWDVLQSCKRKGSLDNDIKEEVPNDIRGFCNNHPTIKRIILCNGSSSAVFFNRHFKEWWLSNELKPGLNKESIQAFQKFKTMKGRAVNDIKDEEKIECVCGIGVSPAAAKYTYLQKREFYKEHCYNPGLEDHHRINAVLS